MSTGTLADFAARTIFILTLGLLTLSGVRAQIPDIQVEQPAGSIVADGGSLNFGLVSIGASSTRVFTVKNTGTGTLLGLGLTKSGPNSGDFTNTGIGAVSLVFLGTTTFSVTFTPLQSGVRNATIRISSNDPNENPYDINVSGTGTAPDISVSQGGGNLTDDVSTVNFGSIKVGLTSTRTFTIRNAGTGTLSNLGVSISGGGFAGGTLSTTSLTSGASTSFNIVFTPGGTFTNTGFVRISSNDPDENPFDVALRGTGIVPTMEVEQPEGTLLNDESSTVDFGSADPGSSVPLTFTLRNVSSGQLTGLAVTSDGANAGDYIVEPLSATTLDPGNTLTFTVRFTPSAPGDRTATVHVSSNESAANPFDIDVTGSGTSLSDLGDADGDGTANLIEVATAGDPLTGGPQPGVLVRNGDALEFSFSKSVEYIPLVYFTVEWSDGLVVWNGTPDQNSTIVSDDGTVQVVKYTLPAGARFVRLRITRG